MFYPKFGEEPLLLRLLMETEVNQRSGIKIPKKYRNIVAEFTRRVLERYSDRIDSIILFGSVVRGKAGKESDIDILVVTTGNRFAMRRDLSGIVLDILLGTGEYISVKTLSVEDFRLLKEIKSSFLNNVLVEGVFIERGRAIA